MIGKFRRKDFYIISEQLGLIMIGIGVVTLIPILVALIYGETNYIAFFLPSVFSILIGLGLRRLFAGKSANMRLKHGMMIAAIAWLWAAFIGALILTQATHISFLNAYFESMSAWTGTGMTIYTDLEILPKSILFLRSIEQWIGGLGVVIVVIGILIRPGTAAARLYKSEAREERIRPSIANTVKTIWWIYLLYTTIGIILFIIAGMPIFDSINHTMTAIATGGMSIKNNSIGAYNSYWIDIVAMIIMIIGATSFLVHYRVLKGKVSFILRDIQFQLLIIFTFIFSLLIIINTNLSSMDSIFSSVSAITTTGFSIQPSSIMIGWPQYAKIMLIALMLIGGSAGSTVGAIKLIRIITVLKSIYWEITRIFSPEGSVIPKKIAGKQVKEVEIREAGSFISIYFAFIFITWIVLVQYGYDALNALFEISSIQGCVGLSMGITSSTMPQVPQILMIFNMWIGRLEIIPVLVLIRAAISVIK
ncbi:MAG: TrkH family potassium uptake protein [Methanobacterium sp.]